MGIGTPEYLVTTSKDGRLRIVGRFAPDPKKVNPGEWAKHRLREFRKKYPEAQIWVKGEHLG